MEQKPTDSPPPSGAESCPACGAQIPSAAPEGLCPVCLLNTDTVVDSASPAHKSRHVTGKRAGDAAEPAPEPAAPGLDPQFAVPLEKLRELFPDLEILDLLGAGGMGAVYRARQPRLERMVALKVLTCPPERHADFSLRFEREAQVLARLNHPNIVTIFDFGEINRSDDADSHGNLFYFVMEFVNGADLNRLIDTGELTPEQALKIVPQICDALQYAHDEGITHRDIKPANILVGKKGRVRIADFGLAKLIGADSDALGTGLTLTGTSMGTPHYMAPEQWETSALVDHRADIYSLGVVFYEMLTGERPHGIFDPPSRRIQVDVRLDEVVLKAMEKDVARRYQKASEVKDDVTRVVTTPTPRRTVEQPKRGQAMMAMVAGTVLAALLGGGAWWWQGRQKVEPEKMPEIAGGKVVPSGGDVPFSAIAGPNPGKPGRLRGVGVRPDGGAADLSKVAALDDIVDVAGHLGEWVALRSNGETVSFKGDADLTDIARIAWSFDHHYALIDRQGKIHFPKNRPRELSGDFDRARIVDVQLGNEHGIALTGEGRALVFGQRYQEAVGDPGKADGYGTPRWPQPAASALINIKEIAVTCTHAATLSVDGKLSVFGWEGRGEFDLSRQTVPTVSISSDEDVLHLLDAEGGVWKLPLARNPSSDQPVTGAGRLWPEKTAGQPVVKLSGPGRLSAAGDWIFSKPALSDLYQQSEISPANAAVLLPDTGSHAGSLYASLMWIEPKLAAMRQRGGRLRSWAAGTEAVAGLELADGIDDFVRLDGQFYPGGQRWLAIRSNGRSVTPFTDFDRTGELVSLDSHLGVLRSGELLHCWQEQRRIAPGNAIDAAVGPGSIAGFRLVLERSGSVMMMPSGTDGDWVESKLPETRAALAAVSDAVGIACDHGAGIVVRANGEVISWSAGFDLVVADPPVQDAVEVACHSGRWFALTADGNIRHWFLPGEDWLDVAPPADLGPAFALRARGKVCAAQMADGSWRAWGSMGSGLIEQIESIGPAADLQFYSSARGDVDTLVWIEPDDESAK